jgi:hypothetical protein
MIPLIVEPGKMANSRYGHYAHAAMVGKAYGSKVGFQTRSFLRE